MEDVLKVYQRPFDPKRPLVTLDEGSKQLLDDSCAPLPMQPGQPLREDYEYVRNGVTSFFMLFAPLLCWRHVQVTGQRTKRDFAFVIQQLIDVHFPDAEKIVLVLDNLNTHVGSSLYEAFPPEEARRLLDKLEIHYTPKHGSWLNMAEIELSVLGRQCLDRRLPDVEVLKSEVAAWEEARNAAECTVHWQFTAEDARIKLKKLYPCILPRRPTSVPFQLERNPVTPPRLVHCCGMFAVENRPVRRVDIASRRCFPAAFTSVPVVDLYSDRDINAARNILKIATGQHSVSTLPR